MKKRAFFAILAILCLSPLAAQEKIDLFGYYEATYMGAKVKSSYYQLFTNKLRVDLKGQIADNITFAANINFLTYHGKKNWDVLEFLSDDIVSTIPEEMRILYVIPFENDIVLDNAFVKFSFNPFDLTVGKQQVSLGTGYVWNPTDIFNIKDPLDPTYEQPGHNALRVDVPLGSSHAVSALYSPEENWRRSTKLLQFKGHIAHFDYHLIGVIRDWAFTDFTEFNPESMSFATTPEKRQMLGASTAGELIGLGIWAEYAYNWMEVSEDFTELVVGTDYTFDFQTYVMVEYYHNTLGKADYREYDINDWMRYYAAEQKAISRDQVYVFAQHPVTDLLSLGLINITSFSDGSLAFVPTLYYSLSDDVEIYAYLNFNFGKEGTAYSKSQGNGALIRIRVYF